MKKNKHPMKTLKDEFKGLKPLTKEQAKKAKFGNVFIVHDTEFNPKGPDNKTRRVVLLDKKNGSLLIAPIKHSSPARMELKNFDGGRSVYMDKQRYITKNKVYKKSLFKNTSNDYLTNSEKVELRKRFKAYKKA